MGKVWPVAVQYWKASPALSLKSQNFKRQWFCSKTFSVYSPAASFCISVTPSATHCNFLNTGLFGFL